MAGTIGSLQLNHNLNYFFTSFDPTSLVLPQFSHNSHKPNTLHLTPQSLFMQRGPRYHEYAALRESKLRMKNMKQSTFMQEKEVEEFNTSTSQKKQVIKSPGNLMKRSKMPSSSVLTQDFGSTLKKEHRRLAPTMMEKSVTPALKSKSGKYDGILGKMVEGKKSGSGSGSGSGRGGGYMGRKSYASLEVLKGLGTQARRAINGESRGMTTPRRNCSLDATEFPFSSQF